MPSQTPSASSISSTVFGQQSRRYFNIKAVASSQRYCFICKNNEGRARVPKEARAQCWMEKDISIPFNNRVCKIHLDGKLFSQEALDSIEGTKDGVRMTDEEMADWIFDLTQLAKGEGKRRRYNFDDPKNVPASEYKLLVGFEKEDFDYLVTRISPYLNKSSNRSVRNALAVFLMFVRHEHSQVKILLARIVNYGIRQMTCDALSFLNIF